ncbi:Uncharacterized protein HZ326_26985 [Fusarium oxysporum f. sp. albedinis]|jgi:hypothetical protein|nr:Uncharacterized protein HZ326_26985 [Fusarium oxysporum f. sp. albedinis]
MLFPASQWGLGPRAREPHLFSQSPLATKDQAKPYQPEYIQPSPKDHLLGTMQLENGQKSLLTMIGFLVHLLAGRQTRHHYTLQFCRHKSPEWATLVF